MGKKTKRVTGLEPLSYMGVEATTPAQLITRDNDPDPDYYKFNIGTTWINFTTDDVWILTSVDGAQATWTKFTGILTVNGNTGSAQPVDDEISIVGEAVLTTTGSGDTLTIGHTAAADGQLIIGGTGVVPAWGTVTSSDGTLTITAGQNTLDITRTGGGGTVDFITDSGTATAAGGQINVLGGTNINTSGAGMTVTVNLDNSINITGLQVNTFTEGILESDATGVISSTAGTDGQLIIGATGAAPDWANLASAEGSIIITNGANSINLESAVGQGSEYLLTNPDLSATFGTYKAQGVVHDDQDTVWVMALDNTSGSNDNKIYTSTDRTTWTQRLLDNGVAAGDLFTDVHCSLDGYCITCPSSSTAAPRDSWYATDATGAWTQNVNAYPLDAQGTFSGSIYYGNGYWVVLCDSMLYYQSTPPTGAFTVNTSGLTDVLNDAVYANSTWVIVGDNGTVFTQATDPTGAFTSQTSSFLATENINSVTYSLALGLFVIGGDNGKIATSTDGVTWTQRINVFPFGTNVTTVTWDSSNGLFVACGANVTALSRNGIIWFQDYKALAVPGDSDADQSGNIVVLRTGATPASATYMTNA